MIFLVLKVLLKPLGTPCKSLTSSTNLKALLPGPYCYRNLKDLYLAWVYVLPESDPSAIPQKRH
jgi:hypothetical protein